MSRAMRLQHRRSFLCHAQRYAQKKQKGNVWFIIPSACK